jgi:hypothetical protein
MAARREILAFEEGSNLAKEFENRSSAQSWVRRIETWISNLRRDLASDSLLSPSGNGDRWLLYPSANAVRNESSGEIRCQLCKNCRTALSAVEGNAKRRPRVKMPEMARANGMWRGPDPPELARLSYCEAKVINLARVYVSVKRVFLNRGSYAGAGLKEAPLYHQRNVVAYPQNPDAAFRALGMSPPNLARMLQVQFVGSNRSCVRSHPDLKVSLQNLREAFRWLSVNSWPFMNATKHHVAWESGKLNASLESLLQQYKQSLGAVDEGVPAELVQGAARIPPGQAKVLASGPADCVPSECGEDEHDNRGDTELDVGDQCAGVVDGGIDDISPLQIWDEVMKRYKIAQRCAEELERLRENDPSDAKAQIRQRQAIAVAAAVEALTKLHSKEIQK